MTNYTILLQTGGLNPMYMIVLMIVVFYFFMILPQVRRNKAQKKFREELSKGTHIITSGGIHGKIIEMKETTVIIETEEGGKLKIEKTAISPEATQAMNNPKK
jgi:preprotein translocase subunit YajC